MVVPHPDDESLSTGGLIMHQMAKGVPVVVVAVTDGEAAYPSWPHPGLAATRREEQRAALSILGVSVAATLRLGLPDGAVLTHRDQLVTSLEELIEPGDVIVAPWAHDWHPDHAACGVAALAVARSHPSCVLVGSLFWALHHVDPRDHPDVGFAVLELSADELVWRREALRSHSSQFYGREHEPILDHALVERLDQRFEHYVVSP